MLPIKSINKHTITNTSNQQSFCFELVANDLDHCSPSELLNTFSAWEQELNSISSTIKKENQGIWSRLIKHDTKEKTFLKFYHFNKRCILNTNLAELNLYNAESTLCSDAIEATLCISDFFSDVIIKDDYLLCNNKYYQFVRIDKFPKSLLFSGFQMLGNYFVCLHKVDRKESKFILEQRRRINNTKNSDYIRNLSSDHAERQAEDILEDIETDQTNLFKAEAWFIVSGYNLDDLKVETLKLVDNLSKIDAQGVIETTGLTTAFYQFIPGIFPNFLRAKLIPTNYAVNLLPLKRDFIHKDGIDFKSESFHDVKFNIFDSESPNFNLLITGTSGSGKSHFTQKIIHDALGEGLQVIVVEKGNSFEKLVKYHRGQYFEGSFNPLEFTDPTYLKEFIVAAIPNSEISLKDHGKIKRAIEYILESKEIRSFRELILELENTMPEISLYFEDIFPYLNDKVFSPKQFTYVNSEIFPEKIHAPLMIYLTQKMKSFTGRRIFCFDEIWSQLKSSETYFSEYFRLGRKRGIANIAISQNFSDFTDPDKKVGAVIAKLCYFKIFFSQDQSPNEFLTASDVERIKALQTVRGKYSEFLLKSSRHKKICQDYAQPFEYELFTSHDRDGHEFQAFEEKYHSFCSYPELINKWVEFRHDFSSFLKNENEHV